MRFRKYESSLTGVIVTVSYLHANRFAPTSVLAPPPGLELGFEFSHVWISSWINFLRSIVFLCDLTFSTVCLACG